MLGAHEKSPLLPVGIFFAINPGIEAGFNVSNRNPVQAGQDQ